MRACARLRKPASRAARWHRPAWISILVRECPGDRVCWTRPAGRLPRRANFRDASVVRTPCTATDPSMRNAAAFDPLHNAPRSAEFQNGEQTPSIGQKLSGLGSHSILLGSAFKSFFLKTQANLLPLNTFRPTPFFLTGQLWDGASLLFHFGTFPFRGNNQAPSLFPVFDVEPQTVDPYRAAILVVPGIRDMLYIDG